MCDDGKTLAAD